MQSDATAQEGPQDFNQISGGIEEQQEKNLYLKDSEKRLQWCE